MAGVAQFMHQDVANQLAAQKQQLGVQAHSPSGRVAAPSCLLATNDNSIYPHAKFLRKLHHLWEKDCLRLSNQPTPQRLSPLA